MTLSLNKKLDRLNKNNVLYYIIVFFIIYSTDSLLFKTNVSSALRYISWAIICVIGGLVALKYARKQYYEEICVVAIFMIISMVINMEITGGYVFKVLLLFCGLFLSEVISWEEFRSKYINCMIFLSIISLICHLFNQQLKMIDFIPIISNGGVNFKNLIFSNVPLYDYNNVWNIYRNYGIFWEPGVYQAYLNIAIIFCLFGRNNLQKSNYVKAGILAITVITTFSTAGYIILILLVMIFLFKNGNIKGRTLVVLCAVAFAIYAFTKTNISYFVFYKFNRHSASVASTNSRVYSILGNLYTAIVHPFGVGPYSVGSSIYSFTQKYYGISGFAIVNTFLLNFSIFGWFYGSYYLVKLSDFVRSFGEKRMVTLLLFLAMILILSNVSFVYSLMFSYFIFYHENGSKLYLKLFRY